MALRGRSPAHPTTGGAACSETVHSSRVARAADGAAIILPAAPDGKDSAIPRAIRAGIDPVAVRREPVVAPLGKEGAFTPAPARATHVLPFPTASIPRLDEAGDIHTVPLLGKVPLTTIPAARVPTGITATGIAPELTTSLPQPGEASPLAPASPVHLGGGCGAGNCSNYTLSVTAGAYPTEVSWNLISGVLIVGTGFAPTTMSLCLDTGCFVMQLFDQFGDQG